MTVDSNAQILANLFLNALKEVKDIQKYYIR